MKQRTAAAPARGRDEGFQRARDQLWVVHSLVTDGGFALELPKRNERGWSRNVRIRTDWLIAVLTRPAALIPQPNYLTVTD
jgi:hypothetical protein